MTRLTSRAGHLVVLALAVATAARARADDLDDAKQWVAEGDAAEANHDYATAIADYRRALGVKKSAQLYLRLGLAQEESGAVADAMTSYSLAAPLAAGNDKVLALVNSQIDELRPKVGYVALTIASPPASLEVEIAGQPVTDTSVETPVNPGDVDVHARAPGRLDFEQHVHVGAGEHTKVDVSLVAVPVAPIRPMPPAVAPPKPDVHVHPSIPGVVLIATGVIGAAVGAGVFAQGFKYESDLNAKCTIASGQYKGCHRIIDGVSPYALDSKSNTFKGAGAVTLGVGSALGIVGGALLGLSLKHHDTSSATLTPIVGPTTAGAAYGQRF